MLSCLFTYSSAVAGRSPKAAQIWSPLPAGSFERNQRMLYASNSATPYVSAQRQWQRWERLDDSQQRLE